MILLPASFRRLLAAALCAVALAACSTSPIQDSNIVAASYTAADQLISQASWIKREAQPVLRELQSRLAGLLAKSRAVPLLMGLIAVAAISTLWSIDSGATLRRSVWLALSMAFGLYLAWRNDWKSLLNVLAGGFIVLIAGSLASAIMPPLSMISRFRRSLRRHASVTSV